MGQSTLGIPKTLTLPLMTNRVKAKLFERETFAIYPSANPNALLKRVCCFEFCDSIIEI